jgi:ATP-dependent RNA helicase DHX29
VVLVSGETGSGKTTQVPQMLLEGCLASLRGAQCSIVCTQPRRIAAISVADRVAEERGEAGPGKRGALVGYSVRFDSATNATTRLEFCTTGILLRRLSSDPALLKLSHVVVDEVHERTMQSDFLIAMLRDLVQKRRRAGLRLKVILMSATMNTQVISDYFGGCPVLGASGRTFPVKHLFLEDVYEETGYVLDAESSASHRDYQRAGQRKLENSAGSKHKALIKSNWGDQAGDAILNPHVDATSLAAMLGGGGGVDGDGGYEGLDEGSSNGGSINHRGYSITTVRNLSRVNEDRIDMDLVEHVVLHIHETHEPGAILVFVPGMGEIDNLSRRLMSQRCLQGHVVVPLHSSISPKDQKNAFKLHGAGVRKIVISTNIAETSVTIEDIVYVIDTGKHKERRHDASRSMSMLVEDSVSVANANQRKGRAGRVREGTCYALYTRQCYEKRMKKFQTPEIMRVPLEEMILQIHALRLGATADEFLSKVLQPPLKKAVQGATENLIQAGALTKAESLTALGTHLAALPVDVYIGKLLVMGALLQCMSPALSIAACLSHKSPFASLQDKDDIKATRAPFLSSTNSSGSVAAGQQSDHLVLAAAVQGYIDAKASGGMSTASKYAKKYRLSVPNLSTILDMRDQFAAMLESAALARKPSVPASFASSLKWYDDASCPQNAFKSSPEVIKAVLVASMYPSVAVVDEVVPGSAPTWHDGSGAVSIHPTSMLSDISGGALHWPFVVYSEKMKTSKVFLRDVSIASPLAIMLFAREVTVEHRSSLVLIDGWIKLKVTGRCSAMLMAVREKLDELLRSQVVGAGGEISNDGPRTLELVASLLREEGKLSSAFK